MDVEVYTGHDCRLGLNVPRVCGFLHLGSDGSFAEKPWELTPHCPHRLPPVAVFVENPMRPDKGPFFPFSVQQGLPRAAWGAVLAFLSGTSGVITTQASCLLGCPLPSRLRFQKSMGERPLKI